ncbi:hypothetical protein ACM66B_006815 [Microbotryomycetes sp. NB124-2]
MSYASQSPHRQQHEVETSNGLLPPQAVNMSTTSRASASLNGHNSPNEPPAGPSAGRQSLKDTTDDSRELDHQPDDDRPRKKPRRPRLVLSCTACLQDRVNQLEAIVAALANGRQTSPANASPQARLMLPNATAATAAAADDEANVAAALQTLRHGPGTGGMNGASSSGGKARTFCFDNGLLPTGSSDVDSLLSLLPPRPQSTVLLESFKLRVDWVIHVLHVPSFEREFDQFWARLKQGSKEGKQPPASWVSSRLAVILAALALGLHFAPHSSPEIARICEDPAGLAFQLVQGAERALTAANWAGKPQIRSVQAILLISWFYWSVGELDRLIVWVGAAARIAQSLGLHNVSSPKNSLKIPANDFDVAGNGQLFREQLACRLWWTLCSLDWDISYRCRNTTVIRVGDFTTPVPDNYNDEDLLEESRLPRNFDQPTASSYQIVLAQLLQFIQQWKQPRRLPLAQQHITHVHLSYETVTKLHDTLHERARKLPPFFKFDYAGPPLPLHVELQRLQFQKDIHVRLVRVTRRYLFAGPDTPEHESTRSQSRTAATKLLQLIGELCSKVDYAGKLWWIGGYTLQASAVLLASNIHVFSCFSDLNNSAFVDVDAVLDQVKTAASRLHQLVYEVSSSSSRIRGGSGSASSSSSSSSSPSLFKHVEQCLRVIGSLLVEESYSRIVRTQMRFDHIRHSRMLDVITKATMSCSEGDAHDLKVLADELETIAVELTSWMAGLNVTASPTSSLTTTNGSGGPMSRTSAVVGINHALSTMRTTSSDHVPLLAPLSTFQQHPHHHLQHHHPQQHLAQQNGSVGSPSLSSYATLPPSSTSSAAIYMSNSLANSTTTTSGKPTATNNANATVTGETNVAVPTVAAAANSVGTPLGFTSMTEYDDFFRSLGFSAPPLDNNSAFSDTLSVTLGDGVSPSNGSNDGQFQ